MSDPRQQTDPVVLAPAAIRRVVIGAMLVLFLAALDQTIVSTALTSIGADLGHFQLISWLVTAYLLTSTCATAIFGRLSDVYGRRLIMWIVLLTFLAGSTVCALANSMGMLIGARALQGIGGGGLIVLAQTILADIVSPRERGRYSAYFSIVWAGSALLGPALGGLLTEFASWHWIFWINLPIGAVALGLSDRLLRKLTRPASTFRIDYPALALLVVSTTSLLLGLSWGGITYPWTSLPVIGAFGAFIVIAALFFKRQQERADAFLPLRFFRNSVVGPMLPTVFLSSGAFIALSVLAPTFLQIALGLSAGTVGLLMVPMLVASSVTATWTGTHISRTGSYKSPPIVGFLLVIAALLVLAINAQALSAGWICFLLLLVGLGIGPIFPVSNAASQNAVEREDFGAVSGAVSFSRALGASILIAVASALVLSLVSRWIPTAGHAVSLEDLVRHRLTTSEQVEFTRAFEVLFFSIALLFVVALGIFWRVEQRVLRQGMGAVEQEAI